MDKQFFPMTTPEPKLHVCPNHKQRHMDYALCDCNGKKIDWLAVGMKHANNLFPGGVSYGQTVQ